MWKELAMAGAVLLAATGAASAQQPAAVVEMTGGLRYQPSELTIPVGSTVEWRNVSGVVHTVTADPARAANPAHVALPQGAEPFNSGFVQPGASWSHAFTVPGRYAYFCIPHEAAGMIGQITVR